VLNNGAASMPSADGDSLSVPLLPRTRLRGPSERRPGGTRFGPPALSGLEFLLRFLVRGSFNPIERLRYLLVRER
jgi:hypothetical protein